MNSSVECSTTVQSHEDSQDYRDQVILSSNTMDTTSKTTSLNMNDKIKHNLKELGFFAGGILIARTTDQVSTRTTLNVQGGKSPQNINNPDFFLQRLLIDSTKTYSSENHLATFSQKKIDSNNSDNAQDSRYDILDRGTFRTIHFSNPVFGITETTSGKQNDSMEDDNLFKHYAKSGKKHLHYFGRNYYILEDTSR